MVALINGYRPIINVKTSSDKLKYTIELSGSQFAISFTKATFWGRLVATGKLREIALILLLSTSDTQAVSYPAEKIIHVIASTICQNTVE